jgi:D-alanyl-D-alanine carboxypeptidase
VASVEAADGSAPACDGVYQDVLTASDAYGDWDRTVVDTIFMVPKTYKPGDLVGTGVAGGQQVRRLVVADLRSMANAASSAGAALQIVSAYRSYTNQVSTFNGWVRVSGRAAALLASARPGHSEHQLGTAIDFTSRLGADPWTYDDWATTRAGAWMQANAWQYGFVNSYPKGKSPSITCYKYEPWHYRYVGRTLALAIHDAGMTSREYLWQLRP